LRRRFFEQVTGGGSPLARHVDIRNAHACAWARCWRFVALVALLLALDSAQAATELTVVPSSSPAASRIEAIDLVRLKADLARADLMLPERVHVTLIPEGDRRARDVPDWIVGMALEPHDIVIFPERVLAYPYDSLESVFRHEVTHLALSSRAAGATLPRWFHEGVATSVDAGWGFSDRLRLLLETTGNPVTADLSRLFSSDARSTLAQAYGLSAALVADLRRRHGTQTPGAIASRVAAGVPFETAFQQATGETPDDAARTAWTTYRHWTIWVSAVTSQSAVWGVIIGLALLAFLVRARQRVLRRRRWDDEATPPTWPD
jgi:hypothetical protein